MCPPRWKCRHPSAPPPNENSRTATAWRSGYPSVHSASEAFATMRYINWRFTYLLTYLLTYLPLVTATFWWLRGGRGTVCHRRLGPAPHFWHSHIFRQSYGWKGMFQAFPPTRLTSRAPFRPSADVCSVELCTYNSFIYTPCLQKKLCIFVSFGISSNVHQF